VHLELDEQADELVLQPPRDEFFACLGSMLTSFVGMVTSVDRLHDLAFFQVPCCQEGPAFSNKHSAVL
jgi:hypothetical protein